MNRQTPKYGLLPLLWMMVILGCPNPDAAGEPTPPQLPYDRLPWPQPPKTEFSAGSGECSSALKVFFTRHRILWDNPQFPPNLQADFTFTFFFTAAECAEKKFTGLSLFQQAAQHTPFITYQGISVPLFEYSLGTGGSLGPPLESIRFREKHFGGFGSDGYWSYWISEAGETTPTPAPVGFQSRLLTNGSVDRWMVSE